MNDDIFSQFSFQGKNASNKYVAEETSEPTPKVDFSPQKRMKTTVEKIKEEIGDAKIAVRETERIDTIIKNPNITVDPHRFVLPSGHKGQIIKEFMFVPKEKSEE